MDATKRCATCKHWDKYKGVVASWDNPDDVGLCWLAVHEAPERIKEGRKMAARDMEDYWACLETRADFGCVCWEKPTTDH